MGFNFNYEEKDWKKRKEMVEEYESKNIIIYRLHELKIKNTKEIKNIHNEIIGYKVENTKEINDLFYELKKIYEYILYAYDKEIEKQDKQNTVMTAKQYKTLCDHAQGIESYSAPKRGKYYKEPKWCMDTKNKRLENEWKRKEFEDTIGKVLDEQIEEYTKLKNIINVTDQSWFEDNCIRKMKLLLETYEDINICIKAKEKVNNVEITEGIRTNHDKLSDVNIVYDKKFIRTVLNNWNDIVYSAQKNPSHYIHAIYMDFDIALKKIKLTTIQKYTLEKIFNGEPLLDEEKGNYICVIEKMYKLLN